LKRFLVFDENFEIALVLGLGLLLTLDERRSGLLEICCLRPLNASVDGLDDLLGWFGDLKVFASLMKKKFYC
jgi:hypothetical protein